MEKLKPIILRKSDPTETEIKNIKRNPICFVLDRIVDTYNVGSLFRLADAVAIEKMYLCGDMQYPPNSRIHKAAVGTENWVPWEKTDSTLETVKMLKSKGYFTIAVEQDKRSVKYNKLHGSLVKPGMTDEGAFQFPVAVVAGHETEGLPQEVLNEVDLIAEMPMFGINNSFNVWGSTAVIVYKILESLES